MAEVSKFFNAVLKDGKYDREYLASDFADYFRKVLSAGLLLDDNEEYGLQVTTVNGLDVNVAPGSALIKGYSYDNTTNKTLTHNLPESDKDRIDRVVLRLDLRNQSRFIKTFVKEGVSDTSPNPPELQRDDYIYELSLAQVRLRANTASINASDVIDERADEELCGIVQSLVTVPISIFQQQFTAWFNDRKSVYEQEMNDWKDGQKQDFESWSSGERNSFDEWFESIKGALKGDIAADLASRMTSTEIKLENLQEDTAAHLADLASQDENKGASLVGFSFNEMQSTNVREAILETFMLGNSTKEDLVDKLLLVDDSLPIDYNSTWTDVINSVNQISTGKKWASGTITNTSQTVSATIRNLPFEPSVVFFYQKEGMDSTYRSVFKIIFNSNSPNSFIDIPLFTEIIKNIEVYDYNGQTFSSLRTSLGGGNEFYEDGFKVAIQTTSGVYYVNKLFEWVAIE